MVRYLSSCYSNTSKCLHLHYVQFFFNLGWRSKLSPIPHAPLPNLPTLDLNHLCTWSPKIQLGHLSLLQLHGAHFLNPIHLDQPTDHIGAFTAFAGALLRSLPTPHLTFHRSLKHMAYCIQAGFCILIHQNMESESQLIL